MADAELRREQRINATAAMLARFVGVIAWVVAILVIAGRFELGLGLAIGGAGFLGAAVAFGGQHYVSDYLAGLITLIEDRYGEGDTVEVYGVTDGPMFGKVARLGSFSTRIDVEAASWHLANRSLVNVGNRSQRGITTVFDVDWSRPSPPERSAVDALVRPLFWADTRNSVMRDGIVVDTVEVIDGRLQVTVRTTMPLTEATSETMRTRLGGV